MKTSEIPAFITVRSASSRLRGKCFLPFGEKTVIEHVIDRSKSYGFNTIVCTTEQLDDDAIEQIALKKEVQFYRGSTQNKMLRWLKCCEKFELEGFHTIDADDPFFCPEEVNRSYNTLFSNRNIDIVKPTLSSSQGGATVGYSIRTSTLRKILEDIPVESDTEMINGIIDSTKSIVKINLSEPNSYVLKDRLTLDYWEDYVFLSTLKCLLRGKDENRKEIFKILAKIPELTLINKFRNKEWSKKQKETTIYHY